jgi:ParB/RepB/Spo0J family partition protein
MRERALKPVSWMKAKKNVRKSCGKKDLERLGKSMMVRQIQPVICEPDGSLLAGERRWRAAMLVGLLELEAIVTDEPLSEMEIKVMQLTENIHRADLSGFEKWEACCELMELNLGWQAKDLAEHLWLDPSMVTRLLSPSKCILAVQEAFAKGALGISDCYAISKAAEEQQAELLALKLDGASRDRIEQHRRKHWNGSSRTVALMRLRRGTTAGARLEISGEVGSLNDAVEWLGQLFGSARDAQAQGLDLNGWAARMGGQSKKGG